MSKEFIEAKSLDEATIKNYINTQFIVVCDLKEEDRLTGDKAGEHFYYWVFHLSVSQVTYKSKNFTSLEDAQIYFNDLNLEIL